MGVRLRFFFFFFQNQCGIMDEEISIKNTVLLLGHSPEELTCISHLLRIRQCPKCMLTNLIVMTTV